MKYFYLFLSLLLILFVFNFLDKPRFSIEGFEKKSFKDLRAFMNEPKGDWPDWVDVEQIVPSKRSDFEITYINHATFLIQIDGVNILVDPIWSEFASPVQFAGPKRVHLPGVRFEDLPQIDLVLITHNHYDHLDINTITDLETNFAPKFVVGLEVDKYLRRKISKKINVSALNWGEVISFNGVDIYFEKAFHWSKRSLFDYNDTLWGSFVIKGKNKTVYHSGDTGYSDHFKEIGDKYDIDFAMISVGDYEPRWFMQQSHINPREAFLAMQDLGAQRAVGMHFGTFQLASNSYQQVIDDFNTQSLQFSDLDFVLPSVAQVFND